MILVTGATGFVGSAVVRRLVKEGAHQIRVATRHKNNMFPDEVQVYETGDLLPDTDWGMALLGCDIVVHAAARVHVMKDNALDPLAEFRRTNVNGTLNLARQAAVLGIRRFIFISSVKVNGEATELNHPFCSNDAPNPQDPYGVSKMEAEEGLRQIAAQTGMEITSIRPPLVYGPGVRANFLRLLSMVDRGFPLPLGAVNNARSLVSIWNLCDLISKLVESPSLPSGVLMVSDGIDLSTPDLIRRLAIAMGRSPRLMSMPASALRLAGKLTGKNAEVNRLCSSLIVDITDTKRQLGWTPPVSIDEGLARTAYWYLNERRVSGI